MFQFSGSCQKAAPRRADEEEAQGHASGASEVLEPPPSACIDASHGTTREKRAADNSAVLHCGKGVVAEEVGSSLASAETREEAGLEVADWMENAAEHVSKAESEYDKYVGRDQSFREYMDQKKKKLSKQFESEQCSLQCSSIFSGVHITVNGRTNPTASQLRVLMAKQHGGRFSVYPSSAVTHTILSNLPDVKKKKLNGTERLVRVEWIIQSIEAGRLLPWRSFSLYQDPMSLKFTSSGGTIGTLSSSGGRLSSSLRSTAPRDASGSSVRTVEPTPVALAKPPNEASSSSSSEVVLSTRGVPAPVQAVVAPSRRGAPTSKDPHFLEHFYAQSRLHHLSAWRTAFQEQLYDEIASSYHSQEGDEYGAPSPPAAPTALFGVDHSATASSNQLVFHVDMVRRERSCLFNNPAPRKPTSRA